MNSRNEEGPYPENIGNNAFAGPHVVLDEQPALKMRIRYKCEGRSTSCIPGIHSTLENKTYLTARIANYENNGSAIIELVVSCVTKDAPYKAHPHNLVGVGCRNGVAFLKLNKDSMTVIFNAIGIQCTKIKQIKDSLKCRQEMMVHEVMIDPYRQGFAHRNHGANSIGLNALRLCFQAFCYDPNTRFYTALTLPVVSNVIYNKNNVFDLEINHIIPDVAPASGCQKMVILCEKIEKKNIEVRFLLDDETGDPRWEERGKIIQIYKQCAIVLTIPELPHWIKDLGKQVEVFVKLKRLSDNAVSEPKTFTFLPENPGYYSLSHHFTMPVPEERNFPIQQQQQQEQQPQWSNSESIFQKSSPSSSFYSQRPPCEPQLPSTSTSSDSNNNISTSSRLPPISAFWDQRNQNPNLLGARINRPVGRPQYLPYNPQIASSSCGSNNHGWLYSDSDFQNSTNIYSGSPNMLNGLESQSSSTSGLKQDLQITTVSSSKLRSTQRNANFNNMYIEIGPMDEDEMSLL